MRFTRDRILLRHVLHIDLRGAPDEAEMHR